LADQSNVAVLKSDQNKLISSISQNLALKNGKSEQKKKKIFFFFYPKKDSKSCGPENNPSWTEHHVRIRQFEPRGQWSSFSQLKKKKQKQKFVFTALTEHPE
jgi:peroxiredoxin